MRKIDKALLTIAVLLILFAVSADIGNGAISYPEVWLNVWVTGYSAEEGFAGNTSCGFKASWGSMAVDPNYIPYGTILYIPDYAEMCDRYGIAIDCGSAVIGYHIDLWTETNGQAYSLTGNKKVRVLRWGWDGWLVDRGKWF